MSKRVGLRTIQAARKPLVCPAKGVEQVTNGGFEQGNFTGWSTSSTAGVTGWAVVTGGYLSPYEGTHMALWVKDYGRMFYPSYTGVIEQDFATPIDVACFGPSSVFQVAVAWMRVGCCVPAGLSVFKIEVLYSDGTSTTVDISGDAQSTWNLHDLKSVLQAGKKVSGIRITATTSNTPNYELDVFVDACSLQI
jgi:hypothetical protein